MYTKCSGLVSFATWIWSSLHFDKLLILQFAEELKRKCWPLTRLVQLPWQEIWIIVTEMKLRKLWVAQENRTGLYLFFGGQEPCSKQNIYCYYYYSFMWWKCLYSGQIPHFICTQIHVWQSCVILKFYFLSVMISSSSGCVRFAVGNTAHYR